MYRSDFPCSLGYTMPATDYELPEIEKMFAVNVIGPMRMVKALHPFFVRTKGTVVNIGSIAGVVPYCYSGIDTLSLVHA
jgi:1-acylglycerone phosphate reductase